ncbi:MAG TPA: DNA methyltransferase [Candidatus Thermoplasmatota archaeon]|nr:DNA methyltransferase [Candidatus Thermoplasmatota archaeon]
MNCNISQRQDTYSIHKVSGKYYFLRKNGDDIESFGRHKPVRYVPELLPGDILDELHKIPDNSIDLAFADPPYGIGIDYGFKTSFKDFTKDFSGYINWCKEWLNLTFQKLKKNGSLYFMNYPKQCTYVQVKILDNLMDYQKTIRWCYESNVGMSPYNFTTASRDILFYTKGKNHTFNGDKIFIPYRNPDDKRIKEQMKNGKQGKTPYDYWFFNLTKNVSKEKITNIVNQQENTPPNQLPEELIKRIIAVSSNRGDVVLSLFAGSGTDLVVCSDLSLCRKAIGIEINPYYCKFIQQRINKKFNESIKNLEINNSWVGQLCKAKKQEKTLKIK